MSAHSNIDSDSTRIPPDIMKIWYEAFNNMTSKEIIEVEYLGTTATDDWKLMYANRPAGGKVCTLCVIVVMNPSHIMEHNNGKKHRGNVESQVRKFRHPSINPEKLTIVVNPFAIKNNPIDDKIKEFKEKLRNEITSMNECDMEKIEYKFSNADWNKLFTKNAGGYVCNMCKSYTLINVKIIRNHVQTAKHKNNLDFIQALYHPTIAPVKDLLQSPIKKNDVKQSDKVNNDVKQSDKVSVNGLPQKAKDLIEKHSEISVDLLLQIEVQGKINDKWEKLISKPNNTNQCKCTLCNINLIGIVELRKHLKVDVHAKNMKNIIGIYHPILAPFKDTVTTTTAPIIHPVKENTETVKVIDLADKTENIKNNVKPNTSGTNNVKPTTSATNNVKPTNSTTNNVKPTTSTTNNVKPTTSTTNNVKPTTSATNNVKPTTSTTNNVKPTTSTTNNVKPTTSATNNVKPTTSATNSLVKESKAGQKAVSPMNKGNSEPLNEIKKNDEANVLNDINFRSNIPTLSQNDLLLVEFYKENVWHKMIKFHIRNYSCTLCNVTKISNFKCLLDHLKGKKHIFNMSSITRFYHPKKTVPKNDIADQKLVTKTVNSGKTIPAIVTSPASKERQLSIPLNKNTTINSSEVIEVIPAPPEIITVEDSPEREISQGTKVITTNTELKEKHNTNKSINKKTSNNSDSNKDKENIINNQKDNNKVTTAHNIAVKDTVKDQQPTVDNNKDDDIIVVSSDTQNIVLNPAAVIAKNLNTKTADIHDGPQYQQNIIIEPRYKSGQKSTETKSSSSNTKDDKIPKFSTKIINQHTDNYIEGLIGVEYVVKIIQHAADDTPRYECCLCEIELGGIAMQNHLRNLKHRLKYLDRHFQTCVKQYNNHRNDGILMTEIVDRIAKAVEKYHGRDLPYECVQSDYRRNRQDIMAKVYSFRHSSELSGPSFTNIVDKAALDDIIRNKHKLGEKIPDIDKRKTTFDRENNDHIKRQRIHSPKSTSTLSTNNQVSNQHFSYNSQNQPAVQIIPTQEQPVPQFPHPYNPIPQNYPTQSYGNPMELNTSLDDAEHRRLAENFIKNTKIRETRSPLSRRRSPPRRHRSRSPFKRYGRSRSPSRRYGRDRRRTPSRSPLRENDVWQAYRRKFEIDVKIIDLNYDGYIKDPQSYPLYNEEWQIFWAKRMNELKLGEYETNKILFYKINYYQVKEKL